MSKKCNTSHRSKSKTIITGMSLVRSHPRKINPMDIKVSSPRKRCATNHLRLTLLALNRKNSGLKRPEQNETPVHRTAPSPPHFLLSSPNLQTSRKKLIGLQLRGSPAKQLCMPCFARLYHRNPSATFESDSPAFRVLQPYCTLGIQHQRRSKRLDFFYGLTAGSGQFLHDTKEVTDPTDMFQIHNRPSNTP